MTPLPGKSSGVRGITMGSQVLMIGNIRLVLTVITSSLHYSGGFDLSSRSYNEIYSLDLNTEEWKLVDNLNVKKNGPAVSSVESNLFDLCK